MPHTILVVDDDRDIASIIRDLLIDEGYEALTAFDGQQALEYIERRDVDLLLSDIRMPRLDGLALISSLRERGWSKPVVLMSAVEASPPRQTDVRFMRKPVDLEELIGVVEGLLNDDKPSLG